MRYEYFIYTALLLAALSTSYFLVDNKGKPSNISQIVVQVDPSQIKYWELDGTKFKLTLNDRDHTLQVLNKENSQQSEIKIDQEFTMFLNNLNPLVSSTFLGEISEVRRKDLQLDQGGAKISFGIKNKDEHNIIIGRINKNDKSKRFILDLKNQNSYLIDASSLSYLEPYL